MDVDLKSLEPVPFIRQVQALFVDHTSDEVRKHLERQQVQFLQAFNSSDFSSADLLESPFFVIGGLKTLSTEERPAGEGTDKLSSNVTTTKRRILKNFYSYNVTFVEWNEFDTFINAQEDVSSRGKLPIKFSNWGDMVRNLILRTMESRIRIPGENRELSILLTDLYDALEAFGFQANVQNGSGTDISFSDLSKEEFLFAEGKASYHLPQRHAKDGHHLCTVGFATKVAKIKWEDTSMTEEVGKEQEQLASAGRSRLLEILGLEDQQKVSSTSAKPSDLTSCLLHQGGEQLKEAVRVVRGLIEKKIIGSRDAVNLWAAVMQACHCTVAKKKTKSIVISAEMFWYLELAVQDGKSVVHVSVARKVGSKNFLKTLVQFLVLSQDETQSMTETDQNVWERALDRSTGSARDPQSDDKRKPDHPHGGNDHPSGGKKYKSGGNDHQSGGKSQNMLNQYRIGSGKENGFSEAMDFPAAISDTETMQDCFGYDIHGMAIPWFSQISSPLKVLARGRSGQVTKVIWNSKPVALKTFVLQDDDDRSLQEVYEHELTVLWSLKTLWGTHVPSLLFHKPWATSPMIGLELGEQLPDEMNCWPEEDLHKAHETMEKIEELGWIQTDVRGANFVRLQSPDGNKSYIAMIDYESMERRAQCTQLSHQST